MVLGPVEPSVNLASDYLLTERHIVFYCIKLIKLQVVNLVLKIADSHFLMSWTFAIGWYDM